MRSARGQRIYLCTNIIISYTACSNIRCIRHSVYIPKINVIIVIVIVLFVVRSVYRPRITTILQVKNKQDDCVREGKKICLTKFRRRKKIVTRHRICADTARHCHLHDCDVCSRKRKHFNKIRRSSKGTWVHIQPRRTIIIIIIIMSHCPRGSIL